jgi:hypothetical protein
VSVLAAPAALGADYGRGIFKGKGTSQFDEDRPKTPVEIQVKGRKARVTKLVFLFDCAGPQGPVVRATVETPFRKVKPGPAGGGYYFQGSRKAKEGGTLDVTVFLGLRRRSVIGTADAYADVDGITCSDDVIFKAGKR